MLATRARTRLLEPPLQTRIVEQLLTVLTLNVFLLHYVEANGTEEGVQKFLVRFCRILLHQLVVARELENV